MRMYFSLLLPLLLCVWDMRSTSPQKRFVICGFACFCSAAAQVFSFSQNFLGGHLLKHREILSCCHQQSCKVPFQEGIFRRIFFLEETLIRKRGKLCKRTFLQIFFVAHCKRYEGEERTQLFPCTQIASRHCVILLKVRTQKKMSSWKMQKKQTKRMTFHFPGTSQIRWAPLTSWWSNHLTSDYTTLTCPSLPTLVRDLCWCCKTQNTMYKHKVHWKTSDYTTLTCPSPPCSQYGHFTTLQNTCVGVVKHKIQCANTKYNAQTQSTMHKHKVHQTRERNNIRVVGR